jgi:hypothetical protein
VDPVHIGGPNGDVQRQAEKPNKQNKLCQRRKTRQCGSQKILHPASPPKARVFKQAGERTARYQKTARLAALAGAFTQQRPRCQHGAKLQASPSREARQSPLHEVDFVAVSGCVFFGLRTSGLRRQTAGAALGSRRAQFSQKPVRSSLP